MRKYAAYVDGGCPGNGHHACSMFGSFVVYDTTHHIVDVTHEGLREMEPLMENLRFDVSMRVPSDMFTGRKVTNNAAEALSIACLLIELREAKMLTPNNMVTVYSDSKLVINQLLGMYKVNHQHLRQIYKYIHTIMRPKKYNPWKALCIEWIPGETMKESRLGH